MFSFALGLKLPVCALAALLVFHLRFALAQDDGHLYIKPTYPNAQTTWYTNERHTVWWDVGELKARGVTSQNCNSVLWLTTDDFQDMHDRFTLVGQGFDILAGKLEVFIPPSLNASSTYKLWFVDLGDQFRPDPSDSFRINVRPKQCSKGNRGTITTLPLPKSTWGD